MAKKKWGKTKKGQPYVKKKRKKLTGLKKSSTKKPFGGYSISFNNKTATVEQIFGKKPLPPSLMTKKLWAYVKKNNLGKKR